MGCDLRPLAIAGALLLAGCVERTERIRIHPDGGATLRVEFVADELDELHGPEADAVPVLESRWNVEELERPEGDGGVKYVLRADRTVAAGDHLPDSYVPPTEASPELFLRFPTTVTVEPRADGDRIHFHRVYEARPWAALEKGRERLRTEAERIADDRSFAQLEPAEREQWLSVLLEIERHETETLARAAFLDAAPDAPQDTWLAARRALHDHLATVELAPIAELILAAEADDQNAVRLLQEEHDRIRQQEMDAMLDALREGGWFGGRALRAFERAFAHQRRYLHITENLALHRFRITVEVPGEIVGHNGDESTASSVTWTFDGTEIRDRPLELMVTSIVRR